MTSPIDHPIVDPRHDFDEFRRSHTPPAKRRHARIHGIVVPIPTGDDIPATLLNVDIGDLDSIDPGAIMGILAAMFNEAVVDQWCAKGLKIGGLMIIVAWGMAQAMGDDISFAEAEERLAAEQSRVVAGQARDGGIGAHLAPAAAAAASGNPDEDAHAAAVAEAGKALSSGSGVPSRPTSAASTGYDPRSSPGWGSANSAPFFGG